MGLFCGRVRPFYRDVQMSSRNTKRGCALSCQYGALLIIYGGFFAGILRLQMKRDPAQIRATKHAMEKCFIEGSWNRGIIPIPCTHTLPAHRFHRSELRSGMHTIAVRCGSVSCSP